MGKIIKFIGTLWNDGFKIFGFLAPILSIGYTLYKALDMKFLNIEGLTQLSYAWAFLPLFIWISIAYLRRYLAFDRLESTPAPAPQAVYQNCIIHQYPDGSKTSEIPNPVVDKEEQPFLYYDPAKPFPIVSSNNISSITDSGLGSMSVTFANSVTSDYFVRVSSDKPRNFEVTRKNSDGFDVQFDHEPEEKIKITVEPDK
jgi:hypothetical protein